MKRAVRLYTLTLAAATLTGCMIGPDYSPPEIGEPDYFRFGGGDERQSLGALDWRSVYHDSVLQSLIRDGLAHNPDMASAAAQVLQAQASLTAARSYFFPSFGASYNYDKTKYNDIDANLGSVSINSLDFGSNNASVSLLNYEIDFWGKVRRSTQAARAQLVASVEGRRLVQVGLVSAIATAYFSLLEQDYELQLGHSTRQSRLKELELVRMSQEAGQSPLTDVRQSEVLVAEADASIKSSEKQIGIYENQISALTGRAPQSIPRGSKFTSVNLVNNVPAGLPSDMLRRRPDVRSAEQNLIAATAQIGVAQAQLLPSFTFTASGGVISKNFSNLFQNPVKMWSIGPGVSVPLFTGGRLMANVRNAKAVRDQAEANYRKTIIQSLQEVSNALITREKSIGIREAQGRIIAARSDSLGLIRDRYTNGVITYLELAYNDQQLFAAQLNEGQARLSELLSVVELYRALGGGWDSHSVPPGYPPAK